MKLILMNQLPINAKHVLTLLQILLNIYMLLIFKQLGIFSKICKLLSLAMERFSRACINANLKVVS